MQEAPPFTTVWAGVVYSFTNSVVSLAPHVSHNTVGGGCHRALQRDQSSASCCRRLPGLHPCSGEA